MLRRAGRRIKVAWLWVFGDARKEMRGDDEPRNPS